MESQMPTTQYSCYSQMNDIPVAAARIWLSRVLGLKGQRLKSEVSDTNLAILYCKIDPPKKKRGPFIS